MNSNWMAVAVAVGSLGLAACDFDIMTAVYGPAKLRHDPPPGDRVLDTGFTAWAWSPDSREIIYTTGYAYYSYSGVSPRIEATDVSTGTKRVILPAPTNGDRLTHIRFTVGKEYVYYELMSSTARRSIHRTRIDGTSTPQRILDSLPPGVGAVWPSPDERLVAWTENGWTQNSVTYQVGILDLTSGAREKYALQVWADRLTWSPDAQSLVADMLHPYFGSQSTYQWIKRGTGAVKKWSPPAVAWPITAMPLTETAGAIAWKDATPRVYTMEGSGLAWYNLETAAREGLVTLTESGRHSGLSEDYSATVVTWSSCLREGPAYYGCETQSNRAERVEIETGVRTEILKHQGAAPIAGRISPDGKWFAFDYLNCGYGCSTSESGLWILKIP